jgi:hypothetical protein
MGNKPLQVAGDDIAGQQGFTGAHPVAVAHHGIDLSVVAIIRYGWASSQAGKVLVENRECTTTSALATVVQQLRKDLRQLLVVSMPL